MGSSNALAAYALYASKVPESSMVVLAYMALVSKDADAEPWWSQGHAELAERAMGREPLKPTGDDKADARAKEAMERAVERRITPLFDAGAITVTRHSSGRPGNPLHVRYRLWLAHPAPDAKRRVENRAAPDAKRRARTSGTRRKVSQHPTQNVGTPDAKRRTKEYEEQEEQDKQQDHLVTVDATRTGIARETAATTPEKDATPADTQWPPARTPAAPATAGTPSAPHLSTLCNWCSRPGHHRDACPDRAALSRDPDSESRPAANPAPVDERGDGHEEFARRLAAIKARAAERLPVPAGAIYPDESRDLLPDDYGDGDHAA